MGKCGLVALPPQYIRQVQKWNRKQKRNRKQKWTGNKNGRGGRNEKSTKPF
jgi:hypothetical protein